jgi:hypothetical protein
MSAREPVPQPDAKYADQNWDPGGDRISIRNNHLYGAMVASMNGVGDESFAEFRERFATNIELEILCLPTAPVRLWENG